MQRLKALIDEIVKQLPFFSYSTNKSVSNRIFLEFDETTEDVIDMALFRCLHSQGLFQPWILSDQDYIDIQGR